MKTPSSGKLFLLAGTFLVAVLVTLGAALVRSPGEMQLVKLDERRVSDLRELNRAVHQYYRHHGVLPANLDQLPTATPSRGEMVDPNTGERYAYQITGDLDFNLCAKFDLADGGRREDYPHFYDTDLGVDWRHDAGPSCYALTVRERDPE
jgi:hypothetical protein